MRQLLVSDGTAVSYSSGELAAGAIDVVKRTTDGFESLVATDTIADSDAIQFVMGTAAGTANIMSAWIPGSAVKRWTGKNYVNQVAQITTFSLTTDPTADFEATLKVVRVVDGEGKFERKSWTVNAVDADTVTTLATKIVSDMTGLAVPVASTSYAVIGLPWLTVSFAVGVITLTGSTFVFSPHAPLARFRTVSENMGGSYGTTSAVAAVGVGPIEGYGDPEILKEKQEQLEGTQFGYYNRIQLPLAPERYVVGTDTYDMYNLSFENPTVGQIHGVDNKREIMIAYKVSGTGQLAFQNKINPWLASCPGAFGAIELV